MNSKGLVDRIVRLCEQHGENEIIVLSGVPGTGKTFLALAAAHQFTRHPFLVRQIQFHSSYSYEDFVEGFRPNPYGGFNPKMGTFARWNEAALRDPENRYVLLIEEFTRANISAVLGELMTYIEYRDRFFETPVSGRPMRVAKNITVIATMNPQDRSALELDDALIRRLRIINCPPSIDQLQEVLRDANDAVRDGLSTFFEKMIERHPDTFESLMPFGHGVFAGVQTEADVRELYDLQLRYLVRRNPQVPAHPFAQDIEELFPFTGKNLVLGDDDNLEVDDASEGP